MQRRRVPKINHWNMAYLALAQQDQEQDELASHASETVDWNVSCSPATPSRLDQAFALPSLSLHFDKPGIGPTSVMERVRLIEGGSNAGSPVGTGACYVEMDSQDGARHEAAHLADHNAISPPPYSDSQRDRPKPVPVSEPEHRESESDRARGRTGPSSPRSPRGYRAFEAAAPLSLSTQQQQQPLDLSIPHSASPEPTLHTASSEGSVNLRHPTPGLESLQGAYLSNVERLERTAERLSVTSSDPGDELRKMRLEQKRSSRVSSLSRNMSVTDRPLPPLPRHVSAGPSYSNSIIGTNGAARSGGYSPAAYFTSPTGTGLSRSHSHSTRPPSASKTSRLSRLIRPEVDGPSPDVYSDGSSSSIHSPPGYSIKSPTREDILHNIPQSHRDDALQQLEGNLLNQISNANRPAARPDRPASPTLADHARNLFNDFDGVHCRPSESSSIQQTQTQTETQTQVQAQAQAQAQPDWSSRRVPRSTPSPRPRPQSYAESSLSQNMIYYPAPVPMMLNLPKRLSKLPLPSERERLQSSTLAAARNSTVLLPESDTDMEQADGEQAQDRDATARTTRPVNTRNTRSLADLPPQLRASAFFNQPVPQEEIEVKEESAVATLEGILDASASAPVNAFLDHPMAGQAGADVYRKDSPRRNSTAVFPSKPTAPLTAPSMASPIAPPKKSRNSLNLLLGRRASSNSPDDMKKRMSSRITLSRHSDTKERNGGLEDIEDQEEVNIDEHPEPMTSAEGGSNGMDEANHLAQHEAGGEPEEVAHGGDQVNEPDLQEEEVAEQEERETVPTTLLAELQLRKHKLKKRNRNAATNYPNGMHSTLLEQDAVAAVQKESRKHKHVALAWEDPKGRTQPERYDEDEDVPLAVLFPGGRQKPRLEGTAPLGLMEKRDLEEHEPLSRRRDRLRSGLGIGRKSAMPMRPHTTYELQIPGLTEQGGSDEEGETMGQRLRRLKTQETPSNNNNNNRLSISADFASEVLSQFKVEEAKKMPEKEAVPEKGADLEKETLGQRRKRLQAEREARTRELGTGAATGTATGPAPAVVNRPAPTQRHSMADILQRHPAAGGRTFSQGFQDYGRAAQPQFGHVYDGAGAGAGIPTLSSINKPLPVLGIGATGQGAGMNYGVAGLYSQPGNYGNNYSGMGMMNGWAGAGSPYGGGMMQPEPAPMPFGQMPGLDPQRRDLIDRWRQSVMP